MISLQESTASASKSPMSTAKNTDLSDITLDTTCDEVYNETMSEDTLEMPSREQTIEDTKEGALESPRKKEAVDSKELTLRLIFPHEDGGVLIGKEGKYINRLKETTDATWFITSNNSDNEDRIVILRGSADSISNAVFSLSKHLNEQSQRHATEDAERKTLVLRFLFPFKAVGAIVGPGGSHVQKIRSMEGVHRLHIYKSTIPFTQERIVEAGATATAMGRVAQCLLSQTSSSLSALQESSTLYKPIREGLRQFLDLNRGPQSTASQIRPARHNYADSHGATRKRSLSVLDIDYRTDAAKRSRCMSDELRGGSVALRRANTRDSYPGKPRSRGAHRSPSRSCSPRAHHRHGSAREEKLVIPDRVAGRLIGRNGAYLAQLQSRSGAHIVLSPRVLSMPDRIVTVSGRQSSIANACKLIRESVREFETLTQND